MSFLAWRLLWLFNSLYIKKELILSFIQNTRTTIEHLKVQRLNEMKFKIERPKWYLEKNVSSTNTKLKSKDVKKNTNQWVQNYINNWAWSLINQQSFRPGNNWK